MKQYELADRLDISRSHLSEIETGKKQPSLQLMERYSSEFKIPVSSILFFSENLENTSQAPKLASRQRGAIAKKVITFLQLIEARTARNDQTEQII